MFYTLRKIIFCESLHSILALDFLKKDKFELPFLAGVTIFIKKRYVADELWTRRHHGALDKE